MKPKPTEADREKAKGIVNMHHYLPSKYSCLVNDFAQALADCREDCIGLVRKYTDEDLFKRIAVAIRRKS